MRGVKLAHYGACSNTTGVKLLMMKVMIMMVISMMIIIMVMMVMMRITIIIKVDVNLSLRP